MMKEKMIKDYIKTIIGIDLDVEIIDDTVVLSIPERWHIYLIPERFTMIGCFLDQDIEIAGKLRQKMDNILYIQNNVEKDETIR